MYPYKIIFGLDLYTVALCVGIIACFAVFNYLADKRRIPFGVQKLAVVSGVFGVILGYGCAVLFQAFYNIKTLGRFEISSSTGATFYGGLLGGAAVFLIIYFAAGHFVFKDSVHSRSFFALAGVITPGIALAHSFGRMGCLMAGCCHGSVTDAWYGLNMYGNHGWDKYVPIQLFEAAFLFVLAVFLFIRAKRGARYGLSLYMTLYGVWRFIIEYFRADYRGDTLVSFLTPSQLIALVLVLGGVGIFLLERVLWKKGYCKEGAA